MSSERLKKYILRTYIKSFGEKKVTGLKHTIFIKIIGKSKSKFLKERKGGKENTALTEMTLVRHGVLIGEEEAE